MYERMEGTTCDITDVTQVGPGTVAIRIATPPDFDARPGQFLQVRATVQGEPVTRHYSISSPDADDSVELTVGVDPEGTLSPWLAGAEPGDRVEIAGPFGRVYYDGEPRVVAIAAGPGIGPALAVAERVQRDGGRSSVVYRTADEGGNLVHERRLAALSRAGVAVYVLDVSSDRATVSRIKSILETRPGEQVFVYGFEPFTDLVSEAIRACGRDPFGAKIENFG